MGKGQRWRIKFIKSLQGRDIAQSEPEGRRHRHKMMFSMSSLCQHRLGSKPEWHDTRAGMPLLVTMGREDPLEKEMATHSSILAWESPWTEEPGGYSPGLLRDLEWQPASLSPGLHVREIGRAHV